MSDLIDKNYELPVNKANLNKANLHTNTHMHAYTNTDDALITSESTEGATSREVGKRIEVTQP